MSFLIARSLPTGLAIFIPEEPNEVRKLIANRFRHQAIVALRRRPIDTDLPCTLDDRDLQLSDYVTFPLEWNAGIIRSPECSIAQSP